MTCEECPPGTVTLATGATSNSSCVDAENVLCASCQNGATCRIVQHTYVCDCPLGYSGRECEQITDNCLSEPCYNGATCTSSLGTYNCTCPQGVTGDSCEVDVDDCRNKPCQNGGICVDELNGYSCVCLSTFYGNNCELDNSTDVCVSLPCDNGGTCVSVHNLWRKCLCLPGFLGQDCQVNIDECSSSPCLNGGQCADGNNSYTCTCVTYKGNRCETPRITCDSLTCGNADECYDDYKTGLPQCLCNPGYTQEQGQSDCSLVDVCASSPCQRGGTCINIPGGQTCQCPPGYGGYRCQHDLDDCASTPCLNNGTCEDRFNNYTCDCPIGFTGRDCSSDIDECLSNPCHPPGTYSCNNTYGGFICNCNQGYSGLNCSVYTDNDPCVTNPCLHEGVCRRLTSGFICECENGWTGQRCEVLVNYCVNIANPCLNNASCVSLQNDFICRCPTGTYGRYCDQLPDLCSRLNPCLNLANCSAKGENFTGCSCATGFLGDGCQIRKNYNCDNSPCLNGATCSLDPGSHLSCTCAPGYYGEYCQFDVNECENVTCPGQGACIDGLNRYFCRCPLGKLLPDCTEDLTVMYDLCFESPWRTASASLPFSIPVNNQFLSLSFWVKFSAKTGTGTFLSVFEQSNPDFASGRELLFSFSQDGFLVSPDGTVDKENFGTYSVNNGQWHLIVMTWDTTIGELEVRVNTVRVFHLTNYHQGRLLDKFYWITLGNEFSPANMTSVPVGGFLGCISQVNIFSYILDTNVEVPSLMINPFTVGGRGDVLQWNEFELHGLVSRIRPSTVMDPVCDDCSSPDRTIPTLTCPKDVYLVSTHPYSPVSWSLLQHEEGLVVKTNMTSGTALSIGRHTVVYSASDVNNNTAVCSFRIYIKENNCEFPDLFGGVEKTCQTGGDGNRYTGCSLSCPSSGYTLSRVTPLSYTCGPLGWWETGVDQKCAPIYPTCGNITSTATVNVKVRLVYPATLTACDQVKDTLEMYTREHINTLDTEWGSKLCSQEDCEDVVLSVNCSSATPVVEFIINNVGLKLIGVDGESKSPEQIFTQALLDQNRFHFKEMIPNADPVIILSAVESSLICPDGYLLMGTDCVTCGFGTYLNLTTNLCDYCAKGFYYVSEGNTSCRACPEGTTTECPAAVSLAQCHVVCENGSFFNLTTQTCEICPMGTYQDQSGQFECLACPYNQTTIQNGTTDVKFCFDDCPSGFEVDLQGSCSECVVGTFRVKGDGLLCVPCPPGFTTPSTGSHSILNCTTVICSPGYRADSTNTHCERCPIGHYQPDWNQLDCLPCPENTTTRLDAADNQTLCEDFCLSGYERVGLECVPCPVGQYKNNSYGMLESCVTCPRGYVTPLVASTSSTNCSIYNCTEGSKINYNNTGCELCPLGEYQPQKYQTDCLPCANGSSTRQVGATVCEVICPSGQQLKDGQCEPCPVGYYRNNTGDLFGDCQLCPVDFITDHQGATSVDMCIIGNCTSGQYLLNTTLNCTDCPVGTYQPQKWQTACISCPNDTTTQGEGASQRSQCFLYCDAGYEGVNTTCDPCPVGYYKSMAGALPCLACPSGNRTLDTGATNKSQCHVAACEPGTYLQNNTCKLCPYGQYQRDKWQDDCVPCPPETTTYHLGAANLSSCVKDCEGGFEYSSTTGQCEMCDQGYYRDRSDPTQAQCQPCPLQTITSPGQISTSIIFCFIANCTVPGEYRNPDENLCQPCPRGQYQDQKWQDSCEQCPENYTTFSVGAVSRDQCHMACDSGYEEVNATCVACAVGTFRNQQDTQWCRNCSVGWTTTSTATTEADQCVPNCTRGQYYSEVNGQCELCDRGTYQMELYQRQCSPCGQGTDTRTDGATARDECLSLCHNLIHNCSEHAHCEVNGNRSTCTCKLGYLGDGYHCQHRCNTSDYCFNGGTCVLDVTQSIGCQCHFKYTGDRCQYRKDVESIVPQTWTIIVGSVVGSVAFLSIFIIVSVLLGVTYRHHKAYKMKNAINSLKKKKMSRPFVTRASLSDYGSPTEPPFRLPDSSVQKTNSFNWSPVEEGKLKDVNHIDMGNGMDDSIYQPPREEP
ncbi:uncharacterized protein LOC132544399 [Ylistrum balloti]|uniref:uncharacterized protein LOC132544399 n=1 Tax=Ylistrum balloti TaxID=509963 RepID=UPI002905C916|nr:uncharacterized protein LOC132544399 [Ylistrum balloti]